MTSGIEVHFRLYKRDLEQAKIDDATILQLINDKKLGGIAKDTFLQHFHETKESPQPEQNKDCNCLWDWVDASGNKTCPILHKDPTATWDKVTSKGCPRCPRYLKVIGKKELLIKREEQSKAATPNTQQSSQQRQLTQEEWDKVYDLLIRDNVGILECRFCDFGTKDPKEARNHFWKSNEQHRGIAKNAINAVVSGQYEHFRKGADDLDRARYGGKNV